MPKEGGQHDGGPRVLLVSQRERRPVRSRALLFSLEDLVVEWHGARVLPVPPDPPAMRWRRRAAVVTYRRGARGLTKALLPTPPAAGAGHELMFAGVQGLGDVGSVMPMLEQRDAARVRGCFIEELWAHRLPEYPFEVSVLARCDLIFVGCSRSVEPVQEATGVRTVHLPPSLDALRFTPYPGDGSGAPRSRVIDVYAMGRRDPAVHAALRAWARRTGRFYLFDTAGNAPVLDHTEHRDHLADLIQRTRYFLVAPAKSSSEGAQQEEVGFRFYEGAAAGAVLLGDRPRTETFERFFPYEDAVTPYGGADGIVATLERLDGEDPEEREAIRRRGVANVLRNHDHAHRWRTVLEAAGLPEPPALHERIEDLERRAAALESS